MPIHIDEVVTEIAPEATSARPAAASTAAATPAASADAQRESFEAVQALLEQRQQRWRAD